MENANACQPDDDELDAALSVYARQLGQAAPSPGLPAAIMAEIRALRDAREGLPPPQLREFFRVVAADTVLQDQLAGVADRGGFVRALTQAGAARGFRFQRGEVYALLRHFEAANEGELNDEQLDAVAAAVQGDMQWMWQMLRHKP